MIMMMAMRHRVSVGFCWKGDILNAGTCVASANGDWRIVGKLKLLFAQVIPLPYGLSQQ